MQTKQDSVRFELKSGAIAVDTNTPESMKVAMQSFLDGPDFPVGFLELREPMRAKLKSSAVWIDEGRAGIGVWRLENRDGRLTLVRYPPRRRGTMCLYHATLEQFDFRWKVASFEQERELGPA